MMNLPQRLRDYVMRGEQDELPEAFKSYNQSHNPSIDTTSATMQTEPEAISTIGKDYNMGNVEEFEDIIPVPQDLFVAAEIPEATPKRGPGRPRKDPNAPRAERKPRSARGPGRPRKSLADQLGSTLTMMNMLVQVSPFRGDALDNNEIIALATSLDNAAQVNPRLYKYLSMALVEGGAMAGLFMTVGAIVGRRLARHEVLPVELDDQLGALIALQIGEPLSMALPTEEPA